MARLWRWLDGSAVWLVVVLSAVVVLAELAMRHIGGDPLWDWKTGLWQVAHGEVARRDYWAQGQPHWVNPEWLWADILAVAGRAGYVGWVVVSLIGWMAYVAGLLVLGRLYRVSRGFMVLGLLVGAIVALPWWGFRPQVWAYGAAVWMFGAFSWLALQWRRGDFRWRDWVVAVGVIAGTVVWAQFHGSWLLVPVWGVLEAVLVARRWRVAVFWLGLAVSAVLAVVWLNPWHGAYVIHSLLLTGNSVISVFIAEWMTPNFHIGYVVLGFAVLGFGAVLGVLARRWVDIWWQMRSVVYVLGFVGAALYAVRFMPYLVVGYLSAVGNWQVGARRVLPVVAVWAAVLIPVFGVYAAGHMPLGGVLSPASIAASEEPVGVVPVLERLGVRQVFGQYRWGGFLEAHNFVPWIDGRGQMWSRIGRLQEYVSGRGGFGNPLAVVDRSGDAVAVLSPGNPYFWAVREAGWKQVATGQGWAVFRKPKTGGWPRVKEMRQ